MGHLKPDIILKRYYTRSEVAKILGITYSSMWKRDMFKRKYTAAEVENLVPAKKMNKL